MTLVIDDHQSHIHHYVHVGVVVGEPVLAVPQNKVVEMLFINIYLGVARGWHAPVFHRVIVRSQGFPVAFLVQLLLPLSILDEAKLYLLKC